MPSTFVDIVGDVVAATLNGRALDLATHEHGRLPLPDLAADNVLVVESRQTDTAAGNGIMRTVDPTDKLVYVWTSFECDEARRAWACFDQPDLKAVHGFVVDAHESWTVTSDSAPDSVTGLDDGGRRWTFGDTPRLSTYVTVVNAGPFHEIRSQRGAHDLGLYCRQSLRSYLERDAEELFDLTDRGLRFFGEQFGRPFAQERYDHVFVPNMGGAMENWGCVTWSDASIYRTVPTHAQRAGRADILLHEMAHQWFGDLVTMQWWDDLWLERGVRDLGVELGVRPRHRVHRPVGVVPDRGEADLAARGRRARPATRSGATSPTWRRRWPTSTPSATARALPCSSSWPRWSATRPSPRGSRTTSPSTPGATPPSRTSSTRSAPPAAAT